MQSKAKSLLLAGIALLVLAGCDVEQPVVTAEVATIPVAANNNAIASDGSAQDDIVANGTQRIANDATAIQADDSSDADDNAYKTEDSNLPVLSEDAPTSTKTISTSPVASDQDDVLIIDSDKEDGSQPNTAGTDELTETASEITQTIEKLTSLEDSKPKQTSALTDQAGPTKQADELEIAALAATPDAPKRPVPKINPKAEPVRAIPKTPVLPAPPAILQPASLVGLTNKSLLAELGEADFVRLEGQMQIWQYKLVGCIIDFFLYPADDVSTNPAYFVTDWHGRPSRFNGVLDTQSCYEDLARRQIF